MNKTGYNNNSNVIYKKIAQARKNAGLSQSQLVAKMQAVGLIIDQQSLSRIEMNKRIVRDYELYHLCKILGVSYDYMFEDME